MSSRLAMFAQATRSTQAPPANRIQSVDWAPFVTLSLSGAISTVQFAFSFGYDCAIDAAIVFISADAASIVTPGAKRPIVLNWRERRLPSSSPPTGSQISATPYAVVSSHIPAGMTPVTTASRPFSCTCRPTTPGSPPNCRCQSAWPMMIEPLPVTGPLTVIGPRAALAVDPYSDGSNGRPSSSVTPDMGKNSGVILIPTRDSGSFAPVIVKDVPPSAANRSKLFDARRQSATSGSEGSSRRRFAPAL